MPHHSGAELPGAQALRQMAAQSDSRGLFSDRAPDPAYAGLFLNRELSWLQFNRRVLAEAADETLPGYERLKFLSIYCSNLDEFYMVRVGGLLDRALLQPWHTETVTGLTPREQLRAIYDETAQQQKDFETLWRRVTAALAKQHVEILDFDRLDEADEVLLRRRFDALRPLLSPQVLDAEHPLPFLRNREQYVLVRFAGKRGGAGLVPTTQLPKFFRLTVDGVQKLALTAPLVAHFAPLLFGERRVRETAIVRVTRNADISVRDIMDGCDADLRAVMERLLRRRRRLEPVRAQVQGRVSDEMRALARDLLGLPKRQLFVTSAPADLSFVLAMPGEFDLAGLTCPEVPPAKNVALQKGDYFAYLAQHDLLLALPYQSINPFVDLLYEAADDPDVVSIKITLYRLAGSSRIAAALELYVTGSLNVFNHRTNVELTNRLVCFNIKELGKQLKQLGMLVIQDQVWNRVTVNRAAGKTTRYYVDEFHLLLKGELASWSVEIWKRFRKWGGIPTGITQNIKDLLASREIENIFENSDFIYMLNQAAGDRQILAKQLNISPHQLSYVTHSSEGEGLLFYGNVILPFIDRFPKDTELYRIMTTKPQEVSG